MSTPIPTPRTDALAVKTGYHKWSKTWIESHKQIERELAEADEDKSRLAAIATDYKQQLSEAQDRIDNLTATGIHSCGNHCKRPMCVLRRELAEARGQLINAEMSRNLWMAESNRVKEQRDTLLEATKMLMNIIGPPDDPTWADEFEIAAAWESGTKAIATCVSPNTDSNTKKP